MSVTPAQITFMEYDNDSDVVVNIEGLGLSTQETY